MQGSKKKALKIVKGKTNWISEVGLETGLLHLEGKEKKPFIQWALIRGATP